MKILSDYTVVYVDDDIAVLNKRSGILTAADRYDETAPRLDTAAEKEFGRLFAVHRIDRDTSGIIVYARTARAHKNLCEQFANRTVDKTYHCIVYGHPLWNRLDVNLPLLADGDLRHRTVVNRKAGKPSFTAFRLLGYCGQYAWLSASPQTGRTHQIRAHLAANKLSIVCDPLYGGNQKPILLSEIKRRWHGDEFEERPLLSRLALHAYRISLLHPVSGNAITLTAPYPRDMEAVRKQFAKLFGVDPLQDVDDKGAETRGGLRHAVAYD